jgi:muramoyltetrapeptide carboxypeptidase LdcA involved in peptidoglycan recycling
MLLPKKFTGQSIINFVHTSSPVLKSDLKEFNRLLIALKKTHKAVSIFDVERKSLDPRYLAASENERFKKLKQAIKEVDWLAPIYGGTGCADITRYLNEVDLVRIKRNRPIVNGFSDTTFLLNYLYFKLKLRTFHYANACGILGNNNYKQFFDIISGELTEYSYRRKAYNWLSPNEGPKEKIEGIAIGGNLSTFRDLLDVCDIKPRSWEDYILFIEDLDVDMEDLHRIIISLDQRGLFMHLKAVVLGAMDERAFDKAWNRLNFLFGDKKKTDHVFEYLISDVIEERTKDRDPLYILKVDNFGHGIHKDPMILPIGAKTIIHPDGKIEFIGPFVE